MKDGIVKSRPLLLLERTMYRDGRTLELRVSSTDRNRLLKGPSLH